MQHREAAVRISQTIETVLNEFRSSLNYICGYVKDGEITPSESQKYEDILQDASTILIDSVLEPIYQLYPDLRPRCCGCEDSGKNTEDEQP